MINFHYFNLSPSRAKAFVFGPPSLVQCTALAHLWRSIGTFLETTGEALEPKDWTEELKKRKVDYTGCEVSMPSVLFLPQIKPALPPPGVAASIPAELFSEGFVRAVLLDPSLIMRPPELWEPGPSSARVWAMQSDWEEIVAYLFNRNRGSRRPERCDERAHRSPHPGWSFRG